MNYSDHYNLGSSFSALAKCSSKNIAIKSIEGGLVNYEQIELHSNQIAQWLIKSGLEVGNVVAILNNKTATSYCIMLACLKVGAIYTNIDPKSPIGRFQKMLATCKPDMLFHYGQSEDLVHYSSEYVNQTVDYNGESFLDLILSLPAEFPKKRNSEVTSDSAAYIMFTSGSTGFPKGVVISHYNILNFINWSKETYQISQQDSFTNLNPMHFDNSVFDFYSSFFTGASIIPVTEELTINPRRLLDKLNELKPSIWFSVPSMLVYVLNMRALKTEDLQTLRVVTFGGEGFPKNHLRKLWSFWGERVRFVNVYGPTECTCICSSYDVTSDDLGSDELLPLGHLAPNFYGLVLNGDSKVNPGEIGELCIGGPNVGVGYYNNHTKTQEAFINHPFVFDYSKRVYRSGDLVKQDVNTGMYQFCGRKDNQIKRMGYRIELEEIENVINSLSIVKECAVVYIDDDNYKAKIFACINGQSEDEAEIDQVLKQNLPQYMLPDFIRFFNDLPKNQNGKIDRLQLKTILLK